jgi:hypothetical protein
MNPAARNYQDDWRCARLSVALRVICVFINQELFLKKRAGLSCTSGLLALGFVSVAATENPAVGFIL